MSLATEFSTDAIIKKVRLYDFSTSSQTQYEDTDILLILDDMIRELIMPNLIVLNEGYGLIKEDNLLVAGQTDYPVPKRAILNMLSFVRILRSDGTEKNLERVPPSRINFRDPNRTGTPSSYAMYDLSIKFDSIPLAGTNESYRIHYFRRPNKLVLLASAALVDSVNKATGVVTYVSVPAGFTATSIHDFIYRNSPFTILNEEVQASALAGLTQTFPIPAVQNLNKGDYVCLTGETIVPGIPIEVFQLLIETYMAMSGQAQNDVNKFQIADKLVKERISSIYLIPGARVPDQTISLNILNSPLMPGYFF